MTDEQILDEKDDNESSGVLLLTLLVLVVFVAVFASAKALEINKTAFLIFVVTAYLIIEALYITYGNKEEQDSFLRFIIINLVLISLSGVFASFIVGVISAGLQYKAKILNITTQYLLPVIGIISAFLLYKYALWTLVVKRTRK